MEIIFNIGIPVLLCVISVIGTFLATWWGVRLQRKNKKLNNENQELDDIININANENVVFFPIHFKKTNQKFYNYFKEKIENAKKGIYITGRGLIMSGPDREIALDYIESFKKALEINENLKIVRLQYGENAHKDWYIEFKKLKELFHDRLKFYVLDDISNHDMVHVAAIDPDEDNCVAEIMVPSIKIDGDEKKEIAGSAIFVNKNNSIAESIQERIHRNCSRAKLIKTAKDFDSLIDNKVNVRDLSSPDLALNADD